MENNITAGVAADRFGSNDPVTRGQAVTFLYGIAGRPELEPMPEQVFEDVADSAYYAAPVAWAYTEGITSGTSKTAFSPDAPCKRAQIVTYLYLYFAE